MVDKALGNVSVSHIVVSGEFRKDWAVLRLGDFSLMWFLWTENLGSDRRNSRNATSGELRISQSRQASP
jgi:hypothetical protein